MFKYRCYLHPDDHASFELLRWIDTHKAVHINVLWIAKISKNFNQVRHNYHLQKKDGRRGSRCERQGKLGEEQRPGGQRGDHGRGRRLRTDDEENLLMFLSTWTASTMSRVCLGRLERAARRMQRSRREGFLLQWNQVKWFLIRIML